MEMDIVIVGAGEVGRNLAGILAGQGHRVGVIEADPDMARSLQEALDVQVVEGDGTEAEMQNKAGVPHADLLVAVTDDDLVNMLSCRIAKELGAKKVILRVKDTRRLAGYRYLYKRALGFDAVLSTKELAAEEIVRTVREQHALEVESFAEGRVQVRRLRIPDDSELTSESIAKLRLPAGVLITAVSSGTSFSIPRGDDQLKVKDHVWLIGRGEDLDHFEQLAGAEQLPKRDVVIMGCGGIGMAIANRLDGVADIAVRMIEKDPARAKQAAGQFSKDIMVLVGDATDVALLREERVSDANIFIATTNDDEDNMVACLLAKSEGAERTVAMVNKAGYGPIYDLLGLDLAMSPRLKCANQILRFVRSRSVASIALIADGKGEVLELRAHLEGGRSERKVKSLGLPPGGAMIGAIVREEDVVIPTGETVVEDGDQVIVFTLPEHLERVEQAFGAPDAYPQG